jgi:hypothetical protein
MRTMRTLGTLVVVGGTVALAYGCSAAGNAPIGNDAADGSTPAANYGGDSDGSTSTGSNPPPKKDGGSGGGAYDAGTIVKAPAGSPCDPTVAGGLDTETCEMCGTSTRSCLPNTDGGAGNVWGIWGACVGSVTSADACDPTKTYTSTAYGNCGTMPEVCGSDCHFESGFDCTEPAGACHPTDTKFILGASCSTAGQGRAYTCLPTCAYGSPSACELPPPNPNTITISSTVGTTVNAVFNLAAGSVTPKIDGSDCPATLDSDSTSFIDIAIVNPTARTVTVSLWDGRATTAGTDYDTLMAWYPTPVFPPPDMTACTSANDDCTGTDCTNSTSSGWSSLSGSDAASIPAGGTITLYVGMYATGTSGNVKVYAKTEN